MLLDSFFTEGLELFALLVMNHCMVIFSLLIERMDVENSHGKGWPWCRTAGLDRMRSS